MEFIVIEGTQNIFGSIIPSPPDPELVADGFVLAAFLILGALFAVIPLVLAYLFAPRDKGRGLGAIYECGMPAFGQARDARFGVFYYIYALIFIVFEVDVLYLFPVARIYRYGVGLIGFGEILFFVIILFLAVIYVWKKGIWKWERKLLSLR
jgi:NADH-quinone oxidoreductase subunit A